MCSALVNLSTSVINKLSILSLVTSNASKSFQIPFLSLEKASEWKKQNRDLETIFDSHGRSLADIKREATSVQFRMQQMMEEIETTVRSSGRNVIKNSFFIAHFNYLFKTERDFFIPCSASVAEFSIESGLKKVFIKNTIKNVIL